MRHTIALFSLLLLAACAKEDSSDLAPDVPIYQDYKVLFDKLEDRTRAFATFRRTSSLGTRLQLTGGSSIRFNGQSHEVYTELDNYFYRWTENGMVDVSFEYTKAAQALFLNSIARADTHDIAVPNGVVLSRVNGGQVFWTGRDLEAGEVVEAWLRQSGTNGGRVSVNTTGAGSVVFAADDVEDLSPGTADLYFSRTRTLPLQQADGSAGGRRVVEVEARGTVMVQ